jgi:hypothetical protein
LNFDSSFWLLVGSKVLFEIWEAKSSLTQLLLAQLRLVVMLPMSETAVYRRDITDGECAKLVDPFTGHIIYNAARLNKRKAQNIKMFEESYGVTFNNPTLQKDQKTVICAGHNVVAPCYTDSGQGLDMNRDSMPSGPKETRQLTLTTLQFATNLACILALDNAVVYCRNSRSRSQAVLVVFYMAFRKSLGVGLPVLLQYLKWSMQSQRKAALGITGNSDLFPNHNKFRQVFEDCESFLLAEAGNARNIMVDVIRAFNSKNNTALRLEQLVVTSPQQLRTRFDANTLVSAELPISSYWCIGDTLQLLTEWQASNTVATRSTSSRLMHKQQTCTTVGDTIAFTAEGQRLLPRLHIGGQDIGSEPGAPLQQNQIVQVTISS